jgi:tetratricopeptide (TPR) repeat protein
MTQYEYKVIKVPHNQQTYYCSFMAGFGWQVQSIQESVDRVVNRSLGFSNTTNYGSMNANTYFHPYTNSASTYGYSRNHGWGSQMNMEVTDVQSSLTITLFRDANIPYKYELQQVENRFLTATPAYLKRCAKENKKDQDNWPERRAVQTCYEEGTALLARGRQQTNTQTVTNQIESTQTAGTESQIPASIPADPPVVTLREMEITHNVFQSNEAGIQIRVNFNITNRKGIQCRTVAYFYDEKGQPLNDVNQRFNSVDNKVSVGSTFKPGFDNTFYNDYILFMPYSELDQKDGEYKLSLTVHIYDEVTRSFMGAWPNTSFRYVQNGQQKRGESLQQTTAASTTSTAATNTVPSKPAPKASSKPAATNPPKQAAPLQRPSFAEYSATFCKNLGWDELTEDRKVYLQGLEIAYAGKYKEARKYYKKALSMNPKESRYWIDVVQDYFEKTQFDEALAFLQKGLKQLPDDPGLLYQLGHAYNMKSDWENAEKIIQQIGASLHPYAKYNFYILSGEYHRQRKEYQKAIQSYDQADKLLNTEMDFLRGINQKYCRDLMKQNK